MTQPSPWENLWEQATLWVAGELNDTFRKVHSKSFPLNLLVSPRSFSMNICGFLQNGGTLSNLPFEWDFPRNKLSSYRGTPMTMETSMTLENFRSQDQATPRVYRLRKSLLMEAPPQFLGSLGPSSHRGHFEAQSLKPSKFGSTQCWPIPVSQLFWWDHTNRSTVRGDVAKAIVCYIFGMMSIRAMDFIWIIKWRIVLWRIPLCQKHHN